MPSCCVFTAIQHLESARAEDRTVGLLPEQFSICPHLAMDMLLTSRAKPPALAQTHQHGGLASASASSAQMGNSVRIEAVASTMLSGEQALQMRRSCFVAMGAAGGVGTSQLQYRRRATAT
jgi:hypothetical protein